MMIMRIPRTIIPDKRAVLNKGKNRGIVAKSIFFQSNLGLFLSGFLCIRDAKQWQAAFSMINFASVKQVFWSWLAIFITIARKDLLSKSI